MKFTQASCFKSSSVFTLVKEVSTFRCFDHASLTSCNLPAPVVSSKFPPGDKHTISKCVSVYYNTVHIIPNSTSSGCGDKHNTFLKPKNFILILF